MERWEIHKYLETNTPRDQPVDKEEIRRKIKNYLETMKNGKTQHTTTYGMQQKQF